MQHLLLPADLREGLPAVDRVWEGFETEPVTDSGEFQRGANLKRDVLARLARDDPAAGFERAIGALERSGLATAAGVPALDAPSRAVALSARRPPVSDRRQGVPGAREQGLDGAAVAGRPGVPASRPAGAVRRPAVGEAARRAARPRSVRRRGDRGHRRPRRRVLDRPAAPCREPRERRRHRSRPVLRQAAGTVRWPRRGPRGANDRRAPDDRQGGRRAAAVEGRRDPGRRARGRPDGADRHLAHGRAGADGGAGLRAGEAAGTRGGGGPAAARRRLRDRAEAGADRPPRRGAFRREARDGRRHEWRAAVVRLGARRGPRARHGGRRRRQRARAGDDAGLPRRGTVGVRRTRAAIFTARRAPTPCRCSRCSRAASCDRWTERRANVRGEGSASARRASAAR